MLRRLAVTLLISCALIAGPAAAETPNPGARAARRPTRLPDDLALTYAQAHVEHEVGDYVAWQIRHDAALTMLANNGAFLASLYTPPPLPPPAPTSYVRGNSGGHSDAWWHGVSVCEQGGRNDSFFGYFSFMDGSMGGQPWDVQVAAGNALLARAGAERESQGGPWADSCIDAGYRASAAG